MKKRNYWLYRNSGFFKILDNPKYTELENSLSAY